MIFAVGLQRLESLVHGDRPSAVELLARLERAARTARQRAAQRVIGECSTARPPGGFGALPLIEEPGLPTRPNPLFQPSGAGNRV